MPNPISHTYAPAFPPLFIPARVSKTIHALAEKYAAPDEVETELQRIYLLEKQAEHADSAHHPLHGPHFSRSAEAHFRTGVEEGKAKHRIEDILLRQGLKPRQTVHLANALTRKVVGLAWE